jgi:hypothetical protein
MNQGLVEIDGKRWMNGFRHHTTIGLGISEASFKQRSDCTKTRRKLDHHDFGILEEFNVPRLGNSTEERDVVYLY